MKQKTIQFSRLRYENIPYRKGRVVRIWNQKRKSFLAVLLNDIWKLLKWFKGLYRKDLVVVTVLLLALLPEPHHVKALVIPTEPRYIHPVARLQPAVAISTPVPEELAPIPEPQPVAPVVAPVAVTTGDAKGYALSLVGSSQFACLEPLWNKESGWNSYAVNSIGAMGIPQALGHGNVFALGDWKAQVDWGLNYISATYGTPCSAWAHSQAYNWY